MGNVVRTPIDSQIIDTEGAVPVILHTSAPGIPDENTLNSLKSLSDDKRLFSHIVALSDVHQKKDVGNPTGSVAVTSKYIIPQLFDSAPNCGMRIVATDLNDDDFKRINPKDLFSNLLKVIPTSKYIGSNIPKDVIVDSFVNGSQSIARYLNVRTLNEVDNTYEKGNLFSGLNEEFKVQDRRELHKVIPPLIVEAARYRLGILGATSSHFVTLMKVDEIFMPSLLKELGLVEGQYVFFIHTGSGIIGRYIGYLYSAQERSPSKKLQLAIAKAGFKSKAYGKVKERINESTSNNSSMVGFTASSPEGKLAVQALQAAGNQGFANRTLLTHKLDLALEKVVGRQIKLKLIYDAPHILLSNESHYGERVWVHRNGASRAYGSNRIKEHPTFSRTGEPIIIAPFENTYGYIGVASNNNKSTFYSGQHELGKVQHVQDITLNYASKHYPAKGAPKSTTITGRGVTANEPLAKYVSYSEIIAKEIEKNELATLACRLTPITKLTHYDS